MITADGIEYKDGMDLHSIYYDDEEGWGFPVSKMSTGKLSHNNLTDIMLIKEKQLSK